MSKHSPSFQGRRAAREPSEVQPRFHVANTRRHIGPEKAGHASARSNVRPKLWLEMPTRTLCGSEVGRTWVPPACSAETGPPMAVPGPRGGSEGRVCGLTSPCDVELGVRASCCTSGDSVGAHLSCRFEVVGFAHDGPQQRFAKLRPKLGHRIRPSLAEFGPT